MDVSNCGYNYDPFTCRIENLRADNAGTYYCIASNAAGSSRPAAAQVFVSGMFTHLTVCSYN